MRTSKLLEGIESSKLEIVELCSELVKIPTPNPPGETERCVRFIEEYFNRQGIPTRIYERVEGKANIVARIEGRGPSTMLWLGHIDVVPEGSREFWMHEPYGGEVEDGLIYGRGSSDMKGTCAAAMVAAKTLHEAGKPPHSVEFWFTCDEEVGGGDGAEWLARDGIIKGDVCIIGDSSGSTPSRPYIDVGCKGMLWTRLKARGRTAHGSTPHLGDNAIEKLLTVTSHIKEMRNYRLDVPRELRRALRSSVNFLLTKEGLSEDQKRATRRLYDYPTVSLNILNGGVKTNVIPDTAEASMDIRLTPGIDFEKAKARLMKLIEESGVQGVTAEFQTGTGYYESPRSQFAKQLTRAVKMVTGSRPTFKILTGGTDAVPLKNLRGIPCLGFGAGTEGQAHAPDEHVPIEDLVMAAKVFTVFPMVYEP